MNKVLLIAAVLAAGVCGRAEASIAFSSASVAGVVAIAAPATGTKNYIKSMTLANDTAIALCVVLKDGANAKGMVCAAANAMKTWPEGTTSQNANSGIQGNVNSFLGESLPVSAAFSVTASTPFAKALAGGLLTISYINQ